MTQLPPFTSREATFSEKFFSPRLTPGPGGAARQSGKAFRIRIFRNPGVSVDFSEHQGGLRGQIQPDLGFQGPGDWHGPGKTGLFRL